MSILRTMTLTVALKDESEIEAEVAFSSWGATRGARSSLGVPEEPDEESGCEIESIISDGVDVMDEVADLGKVETAVMEELESDHRGD